jgi:hypothetical protein
MVSRRHDNEVKQKRAQEAMCQAQADLAHLSWVTTLGKLSAFPTHEVN